MGLSFSIKIDYSGPSISSTPKHVDKIDMFWFFIGVLTMIIGIFFVLKSVNILKWMANNILCCFLNKNKNPKHYTYKKINERDKKNLITFDYVKYEYGLEDEFDKISTENEIYKNKIFGILLMFYYIVGIIMFIILGLWIGGIDIHYFITGGVLFGFMMTYLIAYYLSTFVAGIWLRISGIIYKGKYIELDNEHKGEIINITYTHTILLNKDDEKKIGRIYEIPNTYIWSTILGWNIRLPVEIMSRTITDNPQSPIQYNISKNINDNNVQFNYSQTYHEFYKKI